MPTLKQQQLIEQRRVYNVNKRKRKAHRQRIKTLKKNLREKPRHHYASGFEQKIAKSLEEKGVAYLYENTTIEYMKRHTYTPDFTLPNGILIETKGRFTAADRSKHLLVKAQHPELDIRFVFMRDLYLYKGSSTKYSDWCRKYGYKFSFGGIPNEWLSEVR